MDNIWIFGDSIGLNFNTSPPTPVASSIISLEACASISDEFGNLLFYSSGKKVWDKNNNIMDNGDSLEIGQYYEGDGSSITQGVCIVPKPASSLYYIFQLQFKGLKYSEIDMSMNGGLGKVTSKNIDLYNEYLTEKMQAVKHGNGRDWWLILIDWPDTSNYYTVEEGGEFSFVKFLITNEGISPSFTQEYGAIYHEMDEYLGIGQLKVSSNGTKILDPRGKHFDLYDFDRCSGDIYNIYTVYDVSNSLLYGSEFSSDGSKIYLGNWEYGEQGKLFQYCLNCIQEIEFTKELIYQHTNEWNNTFQLLRALDEKIYLVTMDSYNYYDKVFENIHLSVINSPNNLGSLCNFDTLTIPIGDGKVTAALPNMPNYNLGPLLGSECDTLGTGVNTLVNTGPVSIFPNPSEGIIYFNSGFNFTGNLMVYNLMGELMFVEHNINQSSEIDLTKLRKGMYFLKLIGNDNAEQIFKIVIQ